MLRTYLLCAILGQTKKQEVFLYYGFGALIAHSRGPSFFSMYVYYWWYKHCDIYVHNDMTVLVCLIGLVTSDVLDLLGLFSEMWAKINLFLMITRVSHKLFNALSNNLFTN